jgi:hypothetical protein
MNSLDPWSIILTNPWDEVVVPAPFYGHSLYWDVPSWIHYGNGGCGGYVNSNGFDTRRLLFDGAFIGSAAPSFGGISARKELDGKQVLHVEICVDGKCYRTSTNLAPAIALIMKELSRWHEAEHTQMLAQVSPTTVVGAVEAAVDVAARSIVGTMVGSFLDDIGNAASSVAHSLAGGVATTFKKLRGPIATAASSAAAAGAMLIPTVGPMAAPLAGKLANDLVQSAAGDDEDAKKRVAQAKQQAKTNPVVAVALDQAQKAAVSSTVVHHIQDTANKAAQGHSEAQQLISRIVTEAAKGDPAAKTAVDLITNAAPSDWGSKVFQSVQAIQLSPTDPASQSSVGAWYATVGAVYGVESLEPVTTVGAFLPMALAVATGAYGGMWLANRSWEYQLREAARRGENIYWNDRLLYVPSTQ